MDFRKHGINNRSYQILNEHIDKEIQTRLKWKEKYAKVEQTPNHEECSWRFNFEKVDSDSKLKPKSAYRPLEIKFKPKGNLNALNESEINEYLIKLGVKDPSTYKLKLNDMFEPNEKEKVLIYHGVSGEHEGRYKYLQTRRRYNPENKYPFPVTSAMTYGWNMYDEDMKLIRRTYFDDFYNLEGNLKTNRNCIRNVVATEFFRNNGAIAREDTIKAK
jgi:hypothetical protein